MPLYKYVTFDRLKNILNGSIRFTQPGAFNDPFEMVPEIYVPEGFGDREVAFQFDALAPRRQPVVGVLPEDFESEHLSDRNSRRILTSLNSAIGILCLSKNDSSLLMWSHYADSYSGAIVVFDETHDFFSGQFDMVYSDTRLKIHIESLTDTDAPVPIAELCVKAREWEHENEVRVVRSLTDCRCVGTTDGFPVYIMDVPRECIKAVVLGERMSVRDQREVWEMMKDMDHASLRLDAVSNWGYAFRRDTIKLVGMKNPMISPRTARIFADCQGIHGDMARWLLENHPLSEMVNDTL